MNLKQYAKLIVSQLYHKVNYLQGNIQVIHAALNILLKSKIIFP